MEAHLGPGNGCLGGLCLGELRAERGRVGRARAGPLSLQARAGAGRRADGRGRGPRCVAFIPTGRGGCVQMAKP